MTASTTVIYHSGDYDGIFCREIARKFLPDAGLIGWNFGDALIPFPKEGTVYILDLPPDCLLAQVPNPPNTDCKSRMIWIDHHKSSIEKWPADIPGYRIDGVAACRLAWQWFTRAAIDDGASPRLPQRQDFIDRTVSESLAVRLAGEYDIWDKRDSRAEVFQYGLRSRELTPQLWETMLGNTTDHSITVDILLSAGEMLQNYQQKLDADLVTYRSYRLKWESLNFLVLNTGRFNSLTFAALDVPETGHDALLGYMFNGKCWTVSLYHARHRTDLDLSQIAVRHGGGGHRGACGFTAKALPFALGGEGTEEKLRLVRSVLSELVATGVVCADQRPATHAWLAPETRDRVLKALELMPPAAHP